MKFVFKQIAHYAGYENCCLFQSTDNSAVLASPCYANSAINYFVTTFVEQTLHFLRTHSLRDFTECALQLQTELLANSSVLLIVGTSSEAEDVKAELLVNGILQSTENVLHVKTENDADIFIEVWNPFASNVAPYTNFVAISPSVSAYQNAILERDNANAIQRRHIIFQNESIEINVF